MMILTTTLIYGTRTRPWWRRFSCMTILAYSVVGFAKMGSSDDCPPSPRQQRQTRGSSDPTPDVASNTTNTTGESFTRSGSVNISPDEMNNILKWLPESLFSSNQLNATSQANDPKIVEAFFQQPYHDDEDDPYHLDDLVNSEPAQQLRHWIHDEAAGLGDFLTHIRRTLHVRPELAFQERESSSVIQTCLQRMGFEDVSTGWAINKHPHRIPGRGGTGLVVDIGTGQPPCVLLRADMDALPVKEPGAEDFASRQDGRMHACGHDGHTSMLLGAARILHHIQDSIPGTVRLMFQPAEEGGGGAKRMLEEGLLERHPRPQHAFAMHLWPKFPTGVVAGRPGVLLAATEGFEIVMAGVGGHAGMPHLTVDPIVAAAAAVMNLQTVVSSSLSPLEAGVCSITKVEGGKAYNVIPSSVAIRGTIRALTTDNLLSMRDRVRQIVESTAAVYRCNVTIEYFTDYLPPTVNDPDLYQNFSKPVATLVFHEGSVQDTEPTMGSEDFSFVAQTIPSTFFLLGEGDGTKPASLHESHFTLDEKALPLGVELHVNLALRALRKLRRNIPEQEEK